MLTEAVVPEALQLGVSNLSRLTVIPCSADFSHFRLVIFESRRLARAELGIPDESLVLGCLGSVGGMYLPERFLHLVLLTVLSHQVIQREERPSAAAG